MVLSADGRVAVVTWNVGAGRSALTLLDVRTGHETEIAPCPPPWYTESASPMTDGVLVLTAEGPNDTKGVWWGHDGSELAPLSSPAQGRLHASAAALYSGVDPDEIVRPQLHSVHSSDGFEIKGWLYQPSGPKSVPTVMWLHGGPEAEERPVYSSLFQSLLAEGVAVFAPNVRGSSGFGRTFRSADNGSRRYGAFEDALPPAPRTVDARIAEPGRLAIAGRSMAAILDPRCSDPISGPLPGRSRRMRDVGPEHLVRHDRTLDRRSCRDEVRRPSPGRRAAEGPVTPEPVGPADAAPLLLAHGSDDTNVPFSESEQVATWLDARGMPNRLVVFEGEGHELLATASPGSRLSRSRSRGSSSTCNARRAPRRRGSYRALVPGIPAGQPGSRAG